MKLRWALGWLVLLVAALAYEAAALLDPGDGDTLSEIVKELVRREPEWAGGGVVVLLAWLGWHWLIAPLWKGRRDEGRER